MPFKKKKQEKNYKCIQFYMDMDDALQRDCYELFQVIHRKKSTFLCLLIDDFKSKFKDKEVLSEEDIKSFISSYALIKKIRITGSVDYGEILETASSEKKSNNKQRISIESKASTSEQISNENEHNPMLLNKQPNIEKIESPVDIVDAMAAMNMFTCS